MLLVEVRFCYIDCGCMQVMGACFEIFSTWDDEYDKLQGLLRDIVKKKKEDMKLAWKMNPTHKRLQARLDQMRKSVHWRCC